MQDLLDLDRYPVDRGDGAAELAERCRRDLASTGMFNLEGFVRPEAIRRAVEEIIPLASTAAFTHHRGHNIYFLKEVPGLREDHPALTQTRNFLEKVDVVPPLVGECSARGEGNDLFHRSPEGLRPDKPFEVEHAGAGQIASTPLGQFRGAIPTIDRVSVQI